MDIRTGLYDNNFTRAMETPKSSVILVSSGKCPYTQKNNILMSMTDQLLDILYTQTVREEAGGTYGVICQGSLSKYPDEEGVMQIYFKDKDFPRILLNAYVFFAYIVTP